MDTQLNGKTILITGGTNGIGLITARELARLGAQVTIVSRSAEKCARVAESIETETSHTVEWIAADLSSLAGVRQAAAEFLQRHARLDVLINNAGALFANHQVTVDGYEMTFALNHLNYFLLTNLLLDTIKASAPARIVNVSSNAHLRGRIDFNDLQGQKHYGGMRAYSQSKLANILFTYELARRLEGTGVTANVLHPGFIATGFARNNGFLYNLGMGILGRFIRQPEEGAQTTIYLAASPEVEGITGKYFVDCKETPSIPPSYDQKLQEKLWQVSLELTGLSL
jgi:retinol dehydrogenase 14